MLKLRSEYPTYRAIARALNVSDQRVSQMMRECGFERPSIVASLADTISKEKYLALRREFGWDAAIARRLGVGPDPVMKLRDRYGIPPYRPLLYYKRIKLTRKEFLRIQKAYGSDSVIAYHLGIGVPHVWQFRRFNNIPPFRRWRPLSGLTIVKYRKLKGRYGTDVAVAAHCHVSSAAIIAWKRRKNCR
jgi:hypothetical protein